MLRRPALCLLMLMCAGAQAQQLPAGWHLPTPDELADDARNDSPTRLARAVGDFNGDGIKDKAFLLKSTSTTSEALWVWLSGSSGTHHWLRLDHIAWPNEYNNVPLAMGVETKAPGELVYACFDSDNACNFDSYERRPTMRLRYDAILYFRPESAASAYYWSSSRKRFIRVWLSD